METLIINFHYIRNKKNKYDGIHPVSINQFNKILAKLKREKYNFISPKDFMTPDINHKKKHVMLTFDDGLKDHFRIIKILEKYKIKGLFFICSKPFKNKALDVHLIHYIRSITSSKYLFEFLLKKFPKQIKILEKQKKKICKFYTYDTEKNAIIKYFFNFVVKKKILEKVIAELFKTKKLSTKKFLQKTYMNEKDLKILMKNGHYLGLHGHSHNPLNKINQKINNDLDKNKKILTKITGIIRFKFFAYPYGRNHALPKNLKKFQEKQKIEFCFTMNKGINKNDFDKFNIKRINPNEINQYIK